MYLGVCSSPTSLEDEDCVLLSKVGGKLPKEILKLQEQPLKCQNCESSLWLIAQIHSPIDLDDDEEIRTLFVLACNQKTCKKPTWKAYRYQKPKVIEFKDKDKKSNQKKESSSTNVNNVANKNKDNSNEKKDTSSMLWAKFTSESLTQNKMSDIEALLKLREETNQNINSKPKNSKNNSSNPLNNLLFSAPTVPKVENESTSSESINNTDSSVGNTINKSDNNLINEFDSNYIEFEEEPEDIKHIYDDILKKYKTEIKQCNSNIGEWEGEKYESNYKDKIFYRFQKRIERNQSQCIRYSRRGEPLWIRKETPTSIPDCEICHSKRTFEMQIMPSLIYMLQSSQGVHLDYGTITVYTCSNDHCYQKALNEEYVFVQQSV